MRRRGADGEDRRGRNRRDEDRLDQALREHLAAMPAQPAKSDIEHILIAFRREYATFAQRNAQRLDVINTMYRRLTRQITAALTVLAIILTGLGVEAVRLTRHQNQTVAEVQADHRLSLQVTCAALSAISQAGRAVIAHGTQAVSPAQERALRHLGFPPAAVRARQGQRAADAYVTAISAAVDARVGRKGDGLVAPNGTIRCRRLERLASPRGS